TGTAGAGGGGRHGAPPRGGGPRGARAAFPRPAPRPAYSVLAHGRLRSLGLPAPRDWRTALHEALPAVREETPRETP
ncbi:hypothetical protein ACFXDP_32260, partial [Streptomyces sp. NPDC059374]